MIDNYLIYYFSTCAVVSFSNWLFQRCQFFCCLLCLGFEASAFLLFIRKVFVGIRIDTTGKDAYLFHAFKCSSENSVKSRPLLPFHSIILCHKIINNHPTFFPNLVVINDATVTVAPIICIVRDLLGVSSSPSKFSSLGPFARTNVLSWGLVVGCINFYSLPNTFSLEVFFATACLR